MFFFPFQSQKPKKLHCHVAHFLCVHSVFPNFCLTTNSWYTTFDYNYVILQFKLYFTVFFTHSLVYFLGHWFDNSTNKKLPHFKQRQLSNLIFYKDVQTLNIMYSKDRGYFGAKNFQSVLNVGFVLAFHSHHLKIVSFLTIKLWKQH